MSQRKGAQKTGTSPSLPSTSAHPFRLDHRHTASSAPGGSSSATGDTDTADPSDGDQNDRRHGAQKAPSASYMRPASFPDCVGDVVHPDRTTRSGADERRLTFPPLHSALPAMESQSHASSETLASEKRDGKADAFQLAATSRAHIGRLDPTVYSDLPPVNFSRVPVNLRALDDEASRSPRGGGQATVPASAAVHPLRRFSSELEVYNDEEEPENAEDAITSSSDDAFNCRCTGSRSIPRHKRSARRLSTSEEDDSGDSDDDDEWGRVTGGLNINPPASSSSSDEEGLFIPEPVIQLDNARQKPALRYHTKEDLQVGTHVWVVDEEDVETLLNNNFNRSYEMVCNGRMRGTVMRHNGDMTMVTFNDPVTEVTCSLTMPRACLSRQPIEPYEGCSNRAGNRAFGSFYCNVGPKGTGGRSTAERRKENLFQQYYECVPAMRVPKNSLGDLAEAQTMFQVGSLKEALEIADRQLAKAEERWEAAQKASASTTSLPPDAGAGGRRAGTPSPAPHANDACRWGRSTGTRSPKTFLVDVLVLRSRIHIFLERNHDALADAKRCVEMEPSWVRAHLTLARAHSALGNWAEATAALRTAAALLPTSSDIQRIASMTNYLVGIQRRLDECGHDVALTLDHLYRKRLRTKKDAHAAGDVLCAEETPILAVSSLFAEPPPGRCSVCFRDGAESMELPGSTPAAAVSSEGAGGSSPVSSAAPKRANFCSRGCQQRASLYMQMEAKHWGSLEKARQLIRSRGEVTVDRWSLEMANMSVRLFFMVVSTHRRLSLQRAHNQATTDRLDLVNSTRAVDLNEEVVLGSASPPPPLPVDVALKHLGLFPLASDVLPSFSREALASLHEVLVADFKEESKRVYDKELLFYLHMYVRTYFTPVPLPPSASAPPPAGGKSRFAFFLPWLVGSTDRRDPAMDWARPADGAGRSVSCPACSIPDNIGRGSADTLAALLASGDGHHHCDSRSRSTASACARGGDAERSSDRKPNCRVVISSAHSTVKAVARCPEDGDGLVGEQRDCMLEMPEGPLLEIEVTRPVRAHEALRISFIPYEDVSA